MKKFIFPLITVAFLSFPILAHAGRVAVEGMSCRGCEKQVTAAVCQNPEISTWFDSCTAKVIDAKAEKGEIRYSLKKGVKMDETKFKAIEKAVADTGRKAIIPESGKNPGGLL